ncbi:MAG: hypothetical protein LBL50_04975 [Candidatus Margulisbacteria bacterium]|nr:hypothetical protein [Candidatus Margulisiibacteriota bacterium]
MRKALEYGKQIQAAIPYVYMIYDSQANIYSKLKDKGKLDNHYYYQSLADCYQKVQWAVEYASNFDVDPKFLEYKFSGLKHFNFGLAENFIKEYQLAIDDFTEALRYSTPSNDKYNSIVPKIKKINAILNKIQTNNLTASGSEKKLSIFHRLAVVLQRLLDSQQGF